MESLPEKLRDLSKKKYFPFVAVIVFAFITALVFALIAFQTNDQTVDDLQRQAQDANRTPSRTSLDNSSRSPFQRIIDAITGRKPVDPSNTTSNTSDTDQNTSDPLQTSQNTNSRNISVNGKGEEILRKIESEATPLPKVSVGRYILNTSLPPKPQQANIHQLKTNYSEGEIRTIASNFGLSPFTQPNTVLDKGKDTYQMYDLDKDLFLAFNARNGSFVFISQNGVQAPTTSTDPRDIAESFVQTTGMMQPCLSVTDAYESTTEPGITIVEIRCRWDYLGAPLMNTVGILNLQDESPLAGVQLGDTGLGTAFASENTNDGDQQGASDFNTMLVRVDARGKVRHIGSNILPIEQTSEVSPSNIIAPDTALAALSAGDTNLTLTSPTGAGYIELTKVYPNGFANAQDAYVNDFVLTYTVIPGIDQQYLCPKWVSRSTGQMSSGYNGLFVSTLQAVNDSRCNTPDLDPTAGTATALSTARATTQAIQTNSFSFNPTPTGPAPTVVTGNAGSLKLDDIVFDFTEVPAVGCPEASTFTNSQVLDANKGIYMMWKAAQQRTWYIVFTKTDTTQGVIDSSSGNLTDAARNEYLSDRAGYVHQCKPRTSTTICPLNAAAKGSIVACILLTTGSPSVYVHSQSARNVVLSAQPVGGIGFVDPIPAATGMNGLISWELFAHSTNDNQVSGLQFANGITRNRAYYEFRRNAVLSELNKVGEPTSGFIVSKNELSGFVSSTLAPRIGFNLTETTDLIAEMNREISTLNSNYVKVSLLPQDFVHSNLKLNLTPQPQNVFRYIFHVSPASGSEKLEAPRINPISPSDYYAVETGVLLGN